MIDPMRLLRFPLFAVVLGAMSLGTVVTGCAAKKQAASPATTAAVSASAGSAQRRVSTGADPDKAPAYPDMYGKPAGSK